MEGEVTAPAAKKQKCIDRETCKTATIPSLRIDPEFIKMLLSTGELGFQRPFNWELTCRYYTLNLNHFRAAILYILDGYLKFKFCERVRHIGTEITDETRMMICQVIVDVCTVALYDKLHTIHGPPSDDDDIELEPELPLPLAEAIENIGVFEPKGLTQPYLCFPVLPEETKLKEAALALWSTCSIKHEFTYVPMLKRLGLPLKSVNTRVKTGSPWWTYKVEVHANHYDFRCIFPPSNYSDHSAILASMFLVRDQEDDTPLQIIQHRASDALYATRLRQIPYGFQLQAFSALCHAPSDEWSLGV